MGWSDCRALRHKSRFARAERGVCQRPPVRAAALGRRRGVGACGARRPPVAVRPLCTQGDVVYVHLSLLALPDDAFTEPIAFALAKRCTTAGSPRFVHL